MRHLAELFGGNVISKKSVFLWALHSPDFNPLDFFLWEYWKENVYHKNPQNVIEPQRSVEEFIANITREMCKRVIKNFKRLVTECISRQETKLNSAYNCMESSEISQILWLISRLVYLNMLYRLQIIKVWNQRVFFWAPRIKTWHVKNVTQEETMASKNVHLK